MAVDMKQNNNSWEYAVWTGNKVTFISIVFSFCKNPSVFFIWLQL